MPKPEGWSKAWSIHAKKYHYFRNRRSLCRTYYLTIDDQGSLTNKINPEEACKICLRILKYGDIRKILAAFSSKRCSELIKMYDQGKNILEYPLNKYIKDLHREIEKFMKSYQSQDKDNMIRAIARISILCDLIFIKIK